MAYYKILIAEDEPIVAREIEFILRRLGYDPVGVAVSGEDVIVQAKALKPDMVLMDIVLEGTMDGIEAAAQIHDTLDIPIAYLTAYTDEKKLNRAKLTEPFGYILKPFEEKELAAVIEMGMYRHALQKELKAKENLLSTTLKSISDAIITLNSKGEIGLINKAAEILLRTDSEAATGRNIQELYTFLDSKAGKPIVFSQIASNNYRYYEVVLKDNSAVSIEIKATKYDNALSESGWVFTLRGVDHLRRQTEAGINAIFNNPNVSVTLVDKNYRIEAFNAYAFKIVEAATGKGLTLHENILEHIIGPVFKEAVQQAMSGTTHFHGFSIIIDGDEYWHEATYYPVIDQSGEVSGVCITSMDVTGRKHSEDALKESEERYKAVVNSLNEGIVITDDDNRITFINQRMSELTQYDSEELLNIRVDSLMPEREDLDNDLRQRMNQHLSGIAGKYNEKLKRKDGSIVWVEISAAPFFDAKGNITGSIGAFSDITARVKTEEALKVNEEKYRRLITNAPVGITRLLLKENRFEVVNNAFLKETGLAPEEFDESFKERRADMIHADDRDRVAKFSLRWFEEGFEGFRHITYRIINKSKETVWLDTFSYADFDENGKAIAVNQISIDVTELKRAEAALADTLQEEFRNTVENLQHIVFKFYKREDGNYAYSLREGKTAGELTTEKVRGKHPKEVFDYYGEETDHHVLVAFTGKPVQCEQYYEGRWRMVAYEPIFKNGEVVEVVGSSVDIHERKEAERQLQESEYRYRMLLEYLPIGILQQEAAEDGSLLSDYANPAFLKHSGYTLEEFGEFQGGRASDRIHPEDRAETLAQFNHWYKGSDDGVLHIAYRFKNKTGEYRWLDNYIIKFPSDRGRMHVQAALDITDQKNNEARLLETTSRLTSLISNLQAGILVESDERQIVLVNQNFYSIFNVPEEITLLRADSTVIFNNFKNIFKNSSEFIQQVNDIIDKREVVVGQEIPMADGRVLERDYIPIFANEVYHGHLWQYRDITARKQAEHELRRALEKERELGLLRTRFVSTVSHEFRTPLTGIMMAAELVEAYSENMTKEQMKGEIKKIKSRVDELVFLLNNFLLQNSATMLRERFRPEPISIEEVCRKSASEIQETIVSKKQRLHLDIAPNIPVIVADKHILHYIFNNLLLNASKYSDQGKAIYLGVKNDSENVIITVRDEGIGIPSADIPKLFTPYQRGSNVGAIAGSGLGLSIVHEFVQMHNGAITIESELNKYTLCTITIPVTGKL